MIKLAVVVAVHNRKNLTDKFLATIFNQSLLDYAVIVVDDGSSDGTSEMIEKKYPHAHLIKGDGTLWWTASTNIAVKYAIDYLKAHFICTMNDDTEADYYLLENLYKTASSLSKSIVGCFSYNIENPKELLYDGSKVNWFTGKVSSLISLSKDFQNEVLIPVTYYVGRGLIIPSSVFVECGLYDEKNFPQSWADNDLIFRAKKKGYQVFSVRSAKQYIYADESKHLKLKKNKKLSNFYKYLFVQQGGGNIISYCKYVVRNYPWYGIPWSLITGTIGRIIGYWKPSF